MIGQRVLNAGEVADGLHLINSGSIGMYFKKTNKLLRKLGPGSFIGHRSLLRKRSHFTYKVLSDRATTFLLPKEQIEEHILENYQEAELYYFLDGEDEKYHIELKKNITSQKRSGKSRLHRFESKRKHFRCLRE